MINILLSTLNQMPESNPASWPWHIFAGVIGGLLGWLLKTWKIKVEIRKLQSEIRKLDTSENRWRFS